MREAEAQQAEAIVEEEIQRFARWMGQLDVLPTIAALREHGDGDRRAGAGRERRPLGGRVARATSRASRRSPAPVMQRLLHEPTIRLQAGEEAATAACSSLRELFGLEDGAGADGAEAEAAPPTCAPLRRRGAG